MQVDVAVKLNNSQPRTIRVEQDIADNTKLCLRHSNNIFQISNKYNYTIEKQEAVKLAVAILDFYNIKHQ